MNHREHGSPARLIYLAGQEKGIAISYIARARSAQNGSRTTLVKLAREAQWEALRFLASAREVRS